MGGVNRILFLFTGLLAFFTQTYGQQLPSKNFTTADGLPNNAIRSLLLDSRGILWIGTENGVSKLENGQFQNFHEADGLAFNSCWAIAEDAEGKLWFGSYGGGVSVYDGQKFHQITRDDGLGDDRIRHFYPYGARMLIGTEDGISVADIRTLSVQSIPETKKNNDLNFTSGFFEASDRLFYSTYREGAYELYWEGNGAKSRPVNDWLPIYSISQENDSLILADKGSVWKVSTHDFIQGKKPGQDFGQSIVWSKIEGLRGESYHLAASLFAKDGGVFRRSGDSLIHLNERLGISSKFILAGAIDRNRGLLYLGSTDQGLFQVRLDEAIIHYDYGQAEVRGFAEAAGSLAILSSKGLEINSDSATPILVTNADFKRVQADFYRTSPHKIPKHLDGFFELDPGTPAAEIEFYELHEDRGSFWTNTNIGIFQVDASGRISTYHPVHSFSMGFTADSKLIETNPYAGVRVYPDPEIFAFQYFEPHLVTTPLQIAKVVGGKDRAYLASVFHGLYHWDGQEFHSYRQEKRWEEAKFKSLHLSETERLYAGTEFGDLYEIQHNPHFQITKKWPREELLGTSILFIETYQDAVFVGTEVGIHILRNGENRFWAEEEGIFRKVFKSAKVIGDELLLGLDRGYYRLRLPQILEQRYPDITLEVSELRINGKNWPQSDFKWFAFQTNDLQLAADQNSLALRFKPRGSFSTSHLRYRYRLQPDRAWSGFSTDALLELPFLPSGDYHIEVEVWDYFSGKMTALPLLRFSIAKPFFLQLWFVAGVILAMLLLFFAIYRDQVRRLQKQAATKQRLSEIKLEALRSQMNPHFIFNAINSIQYYILKKDAPQALAFLSKFSKLIRNTLDQSSKAKILLEEEISYLSRYIELENVRMDHRVDWEISGNALAQKHEINLPPMLIQPLVENVFVHAFSPEHPNPELKISYDRIDSQYLRCTVRDNGRGMQSGDHTHPSKGMLLIREKLSLLPGYTEQNLEFLSSPSGTEVRVLIFIG